LANLMAVLLTSLPVLSLVQLLGGIDPNLLLSGFAASAVTIFSLAAVSMLASVYARKPRDAIVFTYLLVVAYVLVSLFSLVPMWILQAPTRRTSAGELTEYTLAVLELLQTGNPLLMLFELRAAIAAGVPLADVLAGRLLGYALWHGLIGSVCVVWSVLRLRA